jgi:hypothetical protein
MATEIDQDRERLSQAKTLSWLAHDMGANDLITVWLTNRMESHSHGIYCALVPTKMIDKTLRNTSWDLSHGDGMPGTVESFNGRRKRVKYLRFGDDRGIEPLIIDRDFHDIRHKYKEISEEFRHFHNLYHDPKTDRYLKFGDDGNEEIVATLDADRVQIRVKEIRQFLAIKGMHLAVQFDFREDSSHTLSELGLVEGGEDHKNNLMCWGLYFQDFGLNEKRAFSRLLGKRLIPPFPKEKSGFWGFAKEEPKKYVEFVIGVDENGTPISHTSNPNRLANYFGANPKAPNYLTAVHFKKTVLERYYQQPGKYSVEDASVGCRSLWSMSIDNHHDDKVCAWLGDLGRDLSYEEQLYWRAHNIPPMGTVSETFFRRQILGQFHDSDRPEHLFQRRYEELTLACAECLGWRILLPLDPKDMHHLQRIRVPSTDEQGDFDELIQGLAKILIDSINEQQLGQMIPANVRGESKGSISVLEAAFAARNVRGLEAQIGFLRDLQSLRSSGSAHRKGKNYQKALARFGIDKQPSLQYAFKDILTQSIGLLNSLIGVVRGRKFDDGKQNPAS